MCRFGRIIKLLLNRKGTAMPRLTILSLASACVLAAAPVLAQSAATPTPAPQPVVTTPDPGATPAKPAGGHNCGSKARQVMS